MLHVHLYLYVECGWLGWVGARGEANEKTKQKKKQNKKHENERKMVGWLGEGQC